MVKLVVKTSEVARDKWVEETPRRSTYYEKETPAAGSRWEANATEAAPQFKAAVTAPGIELRYVGGIKRVKAAKFIRKVTQVGVARFGPGVTAAKEDYHTGVDPYIKELAVVDVPPRKPRGDPGNLDRVKAIFEALHKKRLAVLAAGSPTS